MKSVVHLMIVHRNRLFRECLTSVLASCGGYQVSHVDGSADLDRFVSVEDKRPDVILIDLGLPGQLSVTLTRHASETLSWAKVVLLAQGRALLANADSEDKLVECLAAGADGCVLEESSLEELQAAVGKVVGGEKFYSPEILPSMCHRLIQSARASTWQQRVKTVELTPREMDVVSLIADGLSNKQIARRLSLSLYTIKNHVHNIVEKLQVENRFQAVDYARRRGWLESLKVMGSAGTGR